jgi:hypothetical protein
MCSKSPAARCLVRLSSLNDASSDSNRMTWHRITVYFSFKFTVSTVPVLYQPHKKSVRTYGSGAALLLVLIR